RRVSKRFLEKSEITAPCVFRGFRAIALVAEILESVARAVIGVEFVFLAELRQLRVDLGHVGRARVFVVLAEEAEDRAGDAAGTRQRRGLAIARLVDAATIEHDRALEGMRARAEEGMPAAHAMAHDAFAALLRLGLLLQTRGGDADIADDLFVIEVLHRFGGVFAGRAAMIEIRRAGDEAVLGEALDDALGEFVEAPAMVADHDSGEGTGAVGHAEDHIHLAAHGVDRNRVDHGRLLYALGSSWDSA